MSVTKFSYRHFGTMYSTGSKALIRQLNRSAVLNLIKAEGPIARVEIARRLNLSGAAVTSIAGELEELGLIRSAAQGPSTGGRPPMLLVLNGNAACVIGIKLMVDQLTAVLCDLEGDVLEERAQPMGGHDLADVTEAIVELVSDLRAAAGNRNLLGVGIGMPGVVDGARGVCIDSPILGWHDAPIAGWLSDRLGLPVMIDNDVNTLAVAEQLYGHGRNANTFVTITLGRGVGCGIVVAGQLLRGRRGGAGEFGHVPVEPNGETCECGRRGCLEAYAGDPALVRSARAAGLIGASDGISELTQAAEAGHAGARALFAEAGERVGMMLAGLVNTLSPDLVIVSGEGMRAQRYVEPAIRRALERHVFPPLAGVPLLVDPWNDAKWARGAATLVLDSFFSARRGQAGHGGAVDLASFAAEAV